MKREPVEETSDTTGAEEETEVQTRNGDQSRGTS